MINSYKREMLEIETAVVAQDKQVKSSVNKVKKALKDTVDLDGLTSKMLLKYRDMIYGKATSHIEMLTKDKGRSQQTSQFNTALNDKFNNMDMTATLTDAKKLHHRGQKRPRHPSGRPRLPSEQLGAKATAAGHEASLVLRCGALQHSLLPKAQNIDNLPIQGGKVNVLG